MPLYKDKQFVQDTLGSVSERWVLQSKNLKVLPSLVLRIHKHTAIHNDVAQRQSVFFQSLGE